MQNNYIIGGLICIALLAACSESASPPPQPSSTPPVQQSAPANESAAASRELSGEEERAAQQVAEALAQANQSPEPEPPAASAEPSELALAKKSGCLACHRVEEKVIGPAWRDVSARYQGDSDARARLIEKVSVGGKGNWDDITGGVPMPPYSPRVAAEDIERLVDFVLSLEGS